ncbi:hypothetical protein AOLI_G00213970 [Acnodon oligacanthus]
MVQQLIFVLSVLATFTVSSDVIGHVGSSVQLDIQDHLPKFHDLSWKFNGTTNIVKYYFQFADVKQYPHYEGRVKFNAVNYSLTLNNLQKTDNGVYEAKVSGTLDVTVAKYKLSVLLDPGKEKKSNNQQSNKTSNVPLTIFLLGITFSFIFC